MRSVDERPMARVAVVALLITWSHVDNDKIKGLVANSKLPRSGEVFSLSR